MAYVFLIRLRCKSFIREMDSSYVVVVAELALHKFAAVKSSKLDHYVLKW
ncbi:MAG TPA: hypothetical protein ACFYD2_07380 [Candidatus Avalokitesvara rifleensis]|nr:hypothetical protein [Candidatus Brocadiales bacterium]